MPKNDFTGSKYFTVAEVSCRCGCGFKPDQDFMEKQDKIREACGFPLPVSGPARCPAYNAQVSKTGTTGPHTTGRALDYGVFGAKALTLMSIALAHGMTGIGVSQKGNQRFIHIDDLPNVEGVQPRPYVWSY